LLFALTEDSSCSRSAHSDPVGHAPGGPPGEHVAPVADLPVEALVQRCAGGDAAAWAELWRRYKPSLELVIRPLLGSRAADILLVEQLTANVWVALWKNDCKRLRGYDPVRGSFISYLRLHAKDEVLDWFRERSRYDQRHQSLGGIHLLLHSSADADLVSDVSRREFEATLGGDELRYFQEHLLGAPKQPESQEFTRAYGYKLKHLLLTKWFAFRRCRRRARNKPERA
jgi:DNA-directed RNA polymerase specialized sigma24 family protein